MFHGHFSRLERRHGTGGWADGDCAVRVTAGSEERRDVVTA